MWQDPWIPGLDLVLAPPEYLNNVAQHVTMSTQIDNTTNNWHNPVVFTLFSPLATASILKIALSPLTHADRQIWKEERDERFSIQSTYQLIHRVKVSMNGESYDAQDFNSLWKSLWKMKIPNKDFCMAHLQRWTTQPPKFVEEEGFGGGPLCVLLGLVGDMPHAFFYCLSVKQW